MALIGSQRSRPGPRVNDEVHGTHGTAGVKAVEPNRNRSATTVRTVGTLATELRLIRTRSERDELLSAVIDAVEEGVVVVSGGRVAYANARISQLFGGVCDHELLAGRPTEDLYEALSECVLDPEGFVALGRQIAAAGRVSRGRSVEAADGRILEQDFVPIHRGGRLAGVWVYRDVTVQRQTERRRERLLEMERQARRSAEEQNRRLRELDDLKSAYVATVSHELRTPLTALRSYVDLLLDPGGDPLSGEQRHAAAAVQRGALRLGRLVDDLLVLAQLQARSLHIERTEVDVPAAVEDAVREVSCGTPRETAITTTFAPGPEIVTDRVRLTQIVSNLLGNAAKFARTQIHCAVRPQGEAWVIEVIDDGPGLAAEDLERVFEPFYRGRANGVAGRQGTGLGLSISAELARLLGGSLSIANRVGSAGAVARLAVPFQLLRSGDARH